MRHCKNPKYWNRQLRVNSVVPDLTAPTDAESNGLVKNRTPISHLTKTVNARLFTYGIYLLTLLHSVRPNLYAILAFLSAIGLIWNLEITKTLESS